MDKVVTGARIRSDRGASGPVVTPGQCRDTGHTELLRDGGLEPPGSGLPSARTEATWTTDQAPGLPVTTATRCQGPKG